MLKLRHQIMGATRLELFIAVGMLALALGTLVVAHSQLHYAVIYFGYFNILTAFVVLLWSLWQLQPDVRRWPRKVLPREGPAIAAVMGVTLLLIMPQPFAFKIVFDELLLSLAAQMMHFDRLAGMPRLANDTSGAYLLLDAVLDKRPLFYPFLVSLVHDISGYRYANSFYLNAMLTFALVRMVHALTLRLANRDAAILAVLLMGTLPMFGIYATSGHFEILNLVMLTLVALLGYHYLRTPSERMLLPLLLALFLLTQVRYESAIYLVTFGLLIIRGWQLAGRIILPWQAFLVPLLYVLPLLHYRLITSGSTRAFQEGPGGREATFSLQYISENLTSAGRFLFAIGKQQPNSYLLTVCGIAAVVCLCIYALRKPKSFGGARPGPTVLFHLLIGIGMLCGLLAVFNFGLFDNYITHRLSLPLHLLWIIAIPCMLSWMPRVYPLAVLMVAIASAAGVLMVMDEAEGIRTGMRFVAVMAVVIVWLMVLWRRPSAPLRQFIVATLLVIAAISLPTSHSALYSQRYDSNRQVMADIHFVEQRSKEQRLLWISNPPPYAGLVNRVSTVPWHMLLPNKEHLMDRLDRHEFDAAYFSALMVRQPDGQYVPHERAPDLSHFETEIVDRVRVAPGRRMDYHRIIGIAKDEE